MRAFALFCVIASACAISPGRAQCVATPGKVAPVPHVAPGSYVGLKGSPNWMVRIRIDNTDPNGMLRGAIKTWGPSTHFAHESPFCTIFNDDGLPLTIFRGDGNRYDSFHMCPDNPVHLCVSFFLGQTGTWYPLRLARCPTQAPCLPPGVSSE